MVYELGLVKAGTMADLCVLRLGSTMQSIRNGIGSVRIGSVWEALGTIEAGEPHTVASGALQ